MTTTQEIIEVLRTHGLPEIGDGAAIVIGPIVAQAIAAAVQAEREACAKIAENRSSGITQAEIHATTRIAKQIAAAIRARKDVTK